MERIAKSAPTGRPLSNVGVVGKTITVRVSSSATEDEIDDFVINVLNKHDIGDHVPCVYDAGQVFICVKPICPYCDMDFGYHSYLTQHLANERCDSS